MRLNASAKFLLLAACLTLAATAMAQRPDKEGYYRWVDDNGEVNFSEKPPVGRDSEFIATQTGRRIPVNDEPAAAPAPESKDAPAKPASGGAAPQKMQVLPEQDPELCRQGQETLRALNNKSKRVRVIDENGEARLLSPEKIEEQRQRAQEMIDLHC